MVKILYEDADILVAEKPAGIESQSSRRFEPDMVSEIKNYLRLSTKLSPKSSTGLAEPYVGVIHRLDKPVSGVMVYAKNQKAAAALSRQVQDGRMRKTYHAVVCGKPVDIVGNYVDYLLKDGKNNYSQVVDKSVEDSKRAELSYRVLGEIMAGNTSQTGKLLPEGDSLPLTLVEIDLKTGRHHQIRVQFAAHGTPLWGDGKYNPMWGGTLPTGTGVQPTSAGARSTGAGVQPTSAGARSASAGARSASIGAQAARTTSRSGSLRDTPALSAVRLSLVHPATGKRMEFSMKPSGAIFAQFNRE